MMNIMSEDDKPEIDEQRERLMKIARFAGFFIVLMIIWYTFSLAEAV